MTYFEDDNKGIPAIRANKDFNFMHPESQKMYRRLIETIKSGVYMADLKGNLFYVNHAFAQFLGYHSKDEALGLNINNELYSDPNDRAKILDKMEKIGFVQDYEIKKTRKDGSAAFFSITSHYIRDEAGKVIGSEGVAHDVTEKKVLEEKLLTEKKKLEEILNFDEQIDTIRELDPLIKFIVNKTANILEANKCSLMLEDEETKDLCIQGAKGLSEEVINNAKVRPGEPVAGLVAKDQKPLLVRNIEYDDNFQRANRPSYRGRSFMSVPIKLDNKFMGVLNVADKVSTSDVEDVFDETDLKIHCDIARKVAVAIDNIKLYKELNFLSVTDPLTQIYNYRQFSNSLEFEIKRLKRSRAKLCIMMIDMDDFKSYNDTFGHPAGDKLLQALGKILKTNLRESDIVCRYAGDEFVAILPNTDVDGALKAAEQIKDAMAEYPFKRKVTLSIGVANYDKGLSQRQFVQNADSALYKAKQSGKNRVCVYRQEL